MRAQVDTGNVSLIETGVLDQQKTATPEVQARLFGKFAFKEKNPPTPYLRTAAVAGQSGGGGGTREGKSPALVKLLSCDHLELRSFARAMLLQDVQLLTRYKQKLEAEAKQLKLDITRIQRLQQQLQSRVTARSRPPSAGGTRAVSLVPAGSALPNETAPKSALQKVEQDCHVALQLASVLEAIQRDKLRQQATSPSPARAHALPARESSDAAPHAHTSTPGSLPLAAPAVAAPSQLRGDGPLARGGTGEQQGERDGLALGRADAGSRGEDEATATVADFGDASYSAPPHAAGGAVSQQGPGGGVGLPPLPRLIYNVVVRNGACR